MSATSMTAFREHWQAGSVEKAAACVRACDALRGCRRANERQARAFCRALAMPHDFIGLPITGRVFFHHLHLFRRRRLRCNNQLCFSIALKLSNTSTTTTSRKAIMVSPAASPLEDLADARRAGRQAPHPATARAAPGSLRRYWSRRHFALRIQDQLHARLPLLGRRTP